MATTAQTTASQINISTISPMLDIGSVGGTGLVKIAHAALAQR